MKGFAQGAIALLTLLTVAACTPKAPVTETPAVDGSAPADSVSESAPESAPESATADVTDPAEPDAGESSTEMAAPEMGTFTVDQLFEVGGGGCGMTLWEPNTDPRTSALFFNGLDETSMWMSLNGEMVNFSRTDASGDEFYGQRTSQTFVSPDGDTQVTVNVTLGEPGEIESVSIPQGTLQLEHAGDTTALAVVGDAGC